MGCTIIVDYHGWPISYEWINSSYLPKIWEQMTTAYEFGMRELWIVNVGDIATQEFPLSYFLDMAYDFGRWGSGAVNQTAEYTRQWTRPQFGSFTEEIQEQIADVLQGSTRLIQKRRPEAMRAMVYHRCMEEKRRIHWRRLNGYLRKRSVCMRG